MCLPSLLWQYICPWIMLYSMLSVEPNSFAEIYRALPSFTELCRALPRLSDLCRWQPLCKTALPWNEWNAAEWINNWHSTMAKKGKKAVTSIPVKKVEYKIIQTTRGPKTRLLKLSPSKVTRRNISVQGSPSKSSPSKPCRPEFDNSSMNANMFEDFTPPVRRPKQKVVQVSFAIHHIEYIARHKMTSFEIGYHSNSGI